MSAETIPADAGAWPQGCIKRSSCARNKACMYGWNGSCQHLQRDIRAEVDAASTERSTRPAEPAPEVEVGDGEVVAWGTETPYGWSLTLFAKEAAKWRKQENIVEPLVRLSTLEAERVRVAYLTEARQKIATAYTLCRDDLAAAKAEADELRLERDEAVAACHENAEAWSFEKDRAETAEAALSRALQDRDGAVRVAVEDERDRLLMAAAQNRITMSGGGSPAWVWLRGEGAMAPAERARLRADQPAGEGGEA